MQKQLMRTAVGIASVFAAVSAFGQIRWSPSFQAAMNQAKATNKLVMVKFYATWDQWGKRMDSDTFDKQPVIALTAKLIPVQINIEKEGAELGKKYKIKNYPTILFVDKNGNDVGTIDGYEADAEFIKHVNVFLKDYAAESGLREKYKSNPRNLDAITGLGVIEANRYHVDASLNLLWAAETIDPGNKTGKLSDLYNAIGDHYQNAGKYEPAIAYFKKAGDTSKVTDKKAYSYLSIAACYMSKDQPSSQAEADALEGDNEKLAALRKKMIENYKLAMPYIEQTLKLPNLKAEDRKIAIENRDAIKSRLGG